MLAPTKTTGTIKTTTRMEDLKSIPDPNVGPTKTKGTIKTTRMEDLKYILIQMLVQQKQQEQLRQQEEWKI